MKSLASTVLSLALASGVFRNDKRGGPTFDKLKSCHKVESQTEFSVGVQMIF